MKPFNLDEFKQGSPAVTRDGETAFFVYHCPEMSIDSRVGSRVDGKLWTHCEDGLVYADCTHARDLVGMQTTTRTGYAYLKSVYTTPQPGTIKVTYEE